MSVNSAGPAGFFSQPAFAAPGARKESEVEKGPSAEVAKAQDEAKSKRVMTPEEQEELRRTLAGMATQEFREILQQDAKRQAEEREAQGLSPTGVVVDIAV